jgi:hypothetical protein
MERRKGCVMGRFTTLIGALALVVTACSASTAPTPPSVPATLTPAATTAAAVTPAATTAAPVTPGATATVLMLSATVTWDGQTCTYAGPTVIPRGATLNFAITNTPAALQGGLKGASLYVVPVADGTTWQMITADAYGPPRNNVNNPPSWVLVDEVRILDVTSTTGGTLGVVMTNNLYDIMCVTAEHEYLYPAILLKVISG